MRAWLIAAVLLILPLIVYWPTVSHEYGFRDDYAHLREVRERPGWLTQLTSSNGRPVYGVVLEASLRDVYEVQELEALRLASTVLLAFVGLLLWWHLRRSGWTETQAAALGAACDVIAGRADRRRVGHRLADCARAGCGRCRVRARRPRAPAKGASVLGPGRGRQRVVLRRRPHLPDERIVRGHAARSRSARSRRHGSARGREMGHHAHRCVVWQLGRRVPRDEPRVHRRCRSRSRANGHRAAPIHQVAMVFPQPSSQLDCVVCAAR